MTSFSELQKKRDRLEKESRDLDRQIRRKRAEIDQINKQLSRQIRKPSAGSHRKDTAANDHM